MERGRKIFVLIGRGYEIFLIPREGVLDFFQDGLKLFDAANNIYREVLTEGQAQNKSPFCIFSYSITTSAHSILVSIAR